MDLHLNTSSIHFIQKVEDTQKIADLERAIKDYIKTGKVIGKEPRSKVKTVRRKVK